MKKFLFGMLISTIGLLFTTICFVYSVIKPGIYNEIGGLLGSLLVNHMLMPFIISLIILLIGLIICGYEAYFNK